MELQDCLIVPKSDLTEIKNMLKQLLSQKEVSSEYITDVEVLVKLGIKKKTLYNWKSSGKIPFYKPEGSSKCYFKLDEIIAFQKGIKHQSNQEIESEAKTYLLKNKK
jgi:predicted DNA-binding transcriptional regulator AlpA